jgi:tetratricopeptide (TPR) repeat protein/pSer/pThr/pTyr-binding forkhead associated (FHA) protein
MSTETTLVEPSLFPRLIVRSGGRVIQEIELGDDLGIGRAEDNAVQLMDPKVSRHHAQIRREGSKFVLTDLGSANGTRVNGVKIAGPHVLRHAERIDIGDTELMYDEAGEPSEGTVTMEWLPSRVDVGRTPEIPASPVSARRLPAVSRSSLGFVIIGALLVIAVIVALLLVLGGGSETPPPALEASATATQGTAATEPAATAPAAIDPQEIDDLLAQADALSRRSKFEEAVAIYQELAERVPDDPRPEIGWAWVLIFDKQAREALPHAQKAMELDPASAEAAAVLSRAHVELEEVDQALEAGQRAVELAPGSAQARAVLAEALMLDGQMDAAVAEADLALVQDINDANAHRVRGWLYHIVDNDMGRAAGELQIAAGLQPELWLRRHELGLLLLDAEDYVTSIIAFQDALGIRPKEVTYTAIGEAYYRLGQYDQARASLEQALSEGADDVETYALLGATYAHLNQCQDAETYYEQALAQSPAHPLALEARELCQSGEPVPSPSPTVASSDESTPIPAPTATAESAVPAPPPASLSGRLAFPVWDSQGGGYDTYVASVDGSGRRLVVEEMHQPAFGPEGEWMAVNGERDQAMNLFILRADGSQLREITEHIEDGLPAWSPDGNSLAFSSTRHGDKQSRIYVIDQVPFEGGKVEGRALNFGPDDVRGEYPAWTEDGRIVYSGCDVTVEPAPCGLFVMSAAPGVHPFEQLTDRKEDTAPDVSGDTVVFMSQRDGTWEVYTVELDGTGLRRLTNNAANDGLPIWSPDGRSIAFVSDQGGAWAVWAMNADGSRQRKLFDLGGNGLAFDWQHESISWAP